MSFFVRSFTPKPRRQASGLPHWNSLYGFRWKIGSPNSPAGNPAKALPSTAASPVSAGILSPSACPQIADSAQKLLLKDLHDEARIRMLLVFSPHHLMWLKIFEDSS